MFILKKMKDLVVIAVFIVLPNIPHQTECMVYHSAFLGRNASTTTEIYGVLQYQGISSRPDVVNELNCTWEHVDGTKLKKIFVTSNCDHLIPNGFQLSTTGFRVNHTDDFTLHVYQSDSTGGLSDDYLAIPDQHLGTEYYVPTYCSLGGYCQIAVAGTTDMTSLNVVVPNDVATGSLSCNGQIISAGEPILFKLNENDVLHIEINESKVDLSGTYIKSDKVVAVFIGARDIPNASFMIEQIPPVNKWGTKLAVAPNYLNDAGDIIKIISQSADTTIHILRYSPFTLSNAGESKELRIDWEMHSTIVASKPVLVIQIMSLNLYNDTSIVHGNPAMVLVPHVEQWINEDVWSNCFQNRADDSILTAVSASEASWDPNDINKLTIESLNVDGFEYYVGRAIPKLSIEEILSSGNDRRSVYSYCEGKSAVLLAADWLWNNQECVQTRPMPGDMVDNDCDGKVDEDSCTRDDLFVKFSSTPNQTTGEIHYKSINVNSASPIQFRVKTCGLAAVAFKVTSDQRKSFSVNISPTMISLLLTCPGGCINGSQVYPDLDGSNCLNEERSFEVRWDIHEDRTEIHFENENDGQQTRLFTVPNQEFNFDMMFMAAYSGSANFTVELPEKDCDKVTVGDNADNYGIEFILPPSTQTSIFLTNADQIDVTATVYDMHGTQQHEHTVSARRTVKIEPNLNDVSFIRATGEISVYALFSDGTKRYGYSILPVDVLGPNYHVFYNSSDTNDITKCDSYTFEEYTSYKTVITTTHLTAAELENQELFQDYRPRALFCGNDNYLVQMPPRESLGRQHYIPPLPLLAGDHGQIRLVASEDSTVVIIRGNYDNLDTIELTGNIHSRAVVPGMQYNISSTKPIQVFLYVKSFDVSNVLASSVVAIPPVEQYTTNHSFPKVLPFDTGFRSAVYEDGTAITIEPISLTGLNNDKKVYTHKAFVLNVRTLVGVSNVNLIVPGDVKYTSKKVCRITKGEPGDGIDNDCDGLIDEELCSENITAGEIDADIDGALNEDCANGTTPLSTLPITLPLSKESIDCPTTETPDVPNNNEEDDDGYTETLITIDNGVTQNINPPSKIPPKAIVYGEGPSYSPVASYGGSAVIPILASTTPKPGTTEETEETCVTDCLCPCGWVDTPKNYTEKELKAVVSELQEKLKVKKTSLSSTIRSKSSATDDRKEAAAVGIVGVIFLVALIGAIFLLDLTTIARDIRLLIGNLRQVFQP